MTQLSYNEAFDPYHTAFRFLRLDAACEFEASIHFDMFRILDFYLLFPFRLQSLRLFSEDREWRKISKSYSNFSPYGDLPEDINLFSRMEPIQRAAISSLVEAKIASEEEWKNGEVRLFRDQIPETLITRFHELNHSMSDIIQVLCSLKEKYPLLGRDGLKDRSGLMEYRYDAI